MKPLLLFPTDLGLEGRAVIPATCHGSRERGLYELRTTSWKRTGLTVHADSAVGSQAAFVTVVGREGITCAVTAGVRYDPHIMQWDPREDAVMALKALSHA